MKKKFAYLTFALLTCVCVTGCAQGGEGNGGEQPPQTYTVTFHVDGATKEVPDQTVTSGGLVEKPTDPIKVSQTVDYVFLGWYLGEEEWNFATDTVTESITLVAKYSDGNKSTVLY